MGADVIRQNLRSVANAAATYLESLSKRSVAPSDQAVEGLAALTERLPVTGAPDEEILSILTDLVAPATVATAGSRYFGFVTGGCLPAALIANWFAGAWDQNAFSKTGSPAGAAVEELALRWLIELFDLPPDTGGSFVTGATMANFMCLAAARTELLEKQDWDVEGDGLFGAPEIQVVVSDEVHPTVLKALRLLGLGVNRVIRIPTDDQGRMLADQWPDQLREPVLLCLQAGNVNTGSFDPAAELIPLAKDSDAWVHVDGAFGLWAAASPRTAHLLDGFFKADSWALDAHKWLNVPYDSGIALVRHAKILRRTVAFAASYFQRTAQREPMDFTPESSRRMRSLEIWAALKSLGREGLADLVERNCRFARVFAKNLRAAGFEVLNDVVLNQVLVSFGTDEKTRAVVTEVQREGTCWCGPTVWHGRAAMRISLSSWATQPMDVERSIEAIKKVASRLQ